MLDLSFSICQANGNKEIHFREWTGTYHSLKNPGGWGVPNPTVAQASLPTLSITFPGATTPVVYLLPVADYPTADPTIEERIPGTGVGLATGAQFEDGIYTIVYSVTVGTIVYTKTQEVYFYGQVKCCVDKMKAKINDSNCECNSEFVDRVLWAQSLLYGLEYASICRQNDRFTNLKDYLEDICESEPCSCS